MRFLVKRLSIYLLLGFLTGITLIIMGWILVSPNGTLSIMTTPANTHRVRAAASASAHLWVGDRVVGQSTQYIGAVEGNIDFNPADLDDLGINTYRIYGGMSRWEPEDDDGVYGWPAIADIKADPNLINWDVWDRTMTHPRYGSDYSWSDRIGEVWPGNAVTLLNALKDRNILPVLTLRNVDSSRNPAWAQRLNPPRTEADWNEWWQHVFATVYWLNVRNDYGIDEFEIHNEPDNPSQGWRGTVEDYFDLVRVSRDAIDHVYRTYLPDRQYSIHAPVSLGGSQWPLKALRDIPDLFDSLNIHNYDTNISNYTSKVRAWANRYGHRQSPLWMGEWGSFTNDYDRPAFALNLIKNMIRAAQPSPGHVFGSHIFSLYDWGLSGKYQGLIGPRGQRRLSYYPFRMGIRALQGGRAVLEIRGDRRPPMAIATQSDSGRLSILMVNDEGVERPIQLDLSALFQTGSGQRWEFSADHLDEITGTVAVQDGQVQTVLPPQSAVLLDLGSG